MKHFGKQEDKDIDHHVTDNVMNILKTSQSFKFSIVLNSQEEGGGGGGGRNWTFFSKGESWSLKS